MSRVISGITVALLLTSMLALALNIQPVKAGQTIYIRADGSIDPPDAPISSVDNVTYTLTGNINESIVVARDNIVLDGNGYTLQGTNESCGVIPGRINVTIKNMNIKGFQHGLSMTFASGNAVFGNNITGNTGNGIILDYCMDNTVSGNNIMNNGGNGVIVIHSSGNIISGNYLSDNYNGIAISSDENVVSNNDIKKSERHGLIVSGDHNVVLNNEVQSCYVGIQISNSRNNTLKNNRMIDNEYNFALGTLVDDFQCMFHDVDTSNLVDNKPIYYWVNKHDACVPLDAGYVALVNCTGVIVENLVLQKSSGILLFATKNSLITDCSMTRNIKGIRMVGGYNNSLLHNIITDNIDGIYVSGSDNNILSHNKVKDNGYGIWLEFCDNNILSNNSVTYNNGTGILVGGYLNGGTRVFNNTVTGNQYGVSLVGTSFPSTVVTNNVVADNALAIFTIFSHGGYMVYHNNFIDNSQQVDNCENSIAGWDVGYPYGGNYWSDYSDVDVYSGKYQDETGSDGIWDHPYVIDEDNQDHYPLVDPHTPTSGFSITASQTSLTIQQGNSDYLQITIMSIDGFNQTVQLSVPGVLEGVIATLNPEQLTPPLYGSATSTFRVSVGTTATPGSYTLTVTGTNGTLTHNVDIFLEVTAAQADLEISVDWISDNSPHEGEPVTINVTVTNIGNAASELGTIELRENINYVEPVENARELTIILCQEKLDPIEPEETKNFSFTWHAVQIVNVDTARRLSVFVFTKGDVNNNNNEAYVDYDLRDPSDFTIGEDAFSFSNGDVSAEEYFNEINSGLLNNLLSFYPWETSTVIANLLRAYILQDGLCHGMARATILYHLFPNEKPVSEKTFDMTKEEVYSDLIASSELPNIVATINDLSKGMDLRTEYEKIVENLGKDDPYPVIMCITSSEGGKKEHHSVTVFNWYDVSENIKNIVVYDPNLPGTAIVVTFNLTSNTAYTPPSSPMDFCNICKVYIHVPGVRERAKNAINDFFKSLKDNVKRIFTFNCPVNVTFTDQYGRVISEVENQIPGAEFEYFNVTDTQIFYLPLNLSYTVQIHASDYGNCTISQITPMDTYVTAFSYETFNLTSQTIAEFNVTAFDANYTLNVDEDGDGVTDYELVSEVESITSEWDIGIVEVDPLKTVVGESYSLHINVTVLNYGVHNEVFNVTVYANMTAITIYTNISLPSGNSTVITFTWNTTGFDKGNYTITAYVAPVSNETVTTDNTLFADQEVCVTIPGDVDGDFDVDLFDAVKLLVCYGAKKGGVNYDPYCDIDGDGDVDLFDAVILLIHYGEKYP